MSKKNRFKPFTIWRYMLYLYAMTAGWPAVFSFMGWLPDWRTNYQILVVLSILTMFGTRSRKMPLPIIILITVQFTSFLAYFFMFADSSYITRILFLVTTFALVSIQSARSDKEFVYANVGFLTIQALMGGIGFVLFMGGVLPVISTFKEFDGHIGQFYGLFTTNAIWDGMTRVAGFFDEPGAFAFWGIIALLFNKLFIDNKKVETILIIGLVSTLSMAYFIQIAIYALLFYKNRFSKMFMYGTFFMILIIGVASVSPEIDRAIFGRFQMDTETGRLEGDNRSRHGEVCFSIWQTSPVFGIGAKNAIDFSDKTGEFLGANPFVFFATDGMFGQLILWLPFLYLFTLGKYRKEYRYTAIILLVGFLQRPYDPTQLLYHLTIYMLILEAYRQIHTYPNFRTKHTLSQLQS